MTATWDGTPKTWSTGELVTAALLNAELRDRMDYLAARIIEDTYILLREEQTSGTSGGTFTSGAWQTRVLNTEVSDTGSLATLGSNQITLAAGTYRAFIKAPGNAVTYHQARLQNVTDAATLLLGTTETANSASPHVTSSVITGIFTIAAGKALEVQHYCTGTKATNGFGVAGSFNTEVYTTVELIRIGD